MINTDYCLERRLSILDAKLHRRYKDCVLMSQTMLTRYQSIFPWYTDHTLLHTMNVTDFCGRLIGDQIDSLSADDIYVLLMGCLFHDVGMGISQKDYEYFKLRLGLEQLTVPLSERAHAEIIRNYHQELSALYLEKYWELLDVPNKAYLFAIMQVCRGHRKTNLTNVQAYPTTYPVDDGRFVHLSYLAPLLCFADELDVAANRNISFLYDIDKIEDPIGQMEHCKHQAILSVEIDRQTITLYAQSDDAVIRNELMLIRDKIEEKLRYCCMVAASRSEFVITQQDVQLLMSNIK